MSTPPDGAQMKAGTRVGRIAQNVLALLRLRLGDAQQEAKGTLRRFVIGIILALVAVIIVLLAVPLLVTTLVLALAQYLPAWLAMAIILASMLVLAAVLLLVARSRLRWKGIRLPQDLKADWEAIRARLEEER